MKKQLLILSLTLLLVFSFWSTANASTTNKTLEAAYPGVKIVVNGYLIAPQDAEGKPVEPFIVNGTTYLPVRSVATALGAEVGWDASTYTVTLNGQTQAVTASLPVSGDSSLDANTVYALSTVMYAADDLRTALMEHYRALSNAWRDCWITYLSNNGNVSGDFQEAQNMHQTYRSRLRSIQNDLAVQTSISHANNDSFGAIGSWADFSQIAVTLDDYFAAWEEALNVFDDLIHFRSTDTWSFNNALDQADDAYLEALDFLSTAVNEAYSMTDAYTR